MTASYNATLGGINLNFNRVFLAWAPGAKGLTLAFSAPGEPFTVPAAGFGAELTDGGPIGHRLAGDREIWSLPRASLRGRGSIWLPVRAPSPYAGAVFAALAAEAGLALPPPEVVGAAAGAGVAVHGSPDLARMLREMLRFSTNITAECVGLRASQARGVAAGDLAASAAAMTGWAQARCGIGATVLANHSGLSDLSRTTARDMIAILTAPGAGALDGLLPERPILDAERKPVDVGGVRVLSKTGTLNFACGLAGYMVGRRRLAFAIFAADADLRAQIRPDQRDDPPGGAAWARRARGQEQALLRRWAALYN